MRNPKERLTSHPKRNNICAAVTVINLLFTAGAILSIQHNREQTRIIREDIAILTLAAQARENQSPRRTEEPIIIFDAAVLKKY